MMRRYAKVETLFTLTIALLTTLGWAPLARAEQPTPEKLVQLACNAAGGVKAFTELGIIKITIDQSEIAQDGTQSAAKQIYYMSLPGPTPGRMEIPTALVVAGDDGTSTGGWAVQAGRADARYAVKYMVRRLLRSDLFTMLLPFSLSWDGPNLREVKAADIDGRPTWRLSVDVDDNFFFSPQIGRKWTIDFDQQSYKLLRAESQFADIGQGIVAEGQRISYSDPVQLNGVTLFGSKKVIGLDERSLEKAHHRIDRHKIEIVSAGAAQSLFGNPVPPDQRPKPPQMKPPAGIDTAPKPRTQT